MNILNIFNTLFTFQSTITRYFKAYTPIRVASKICDQIFTQCSLLLIWLQPKTKVKYKKTSNF